MIRVGIITQARSTSTRLPRKVLLPAGGRTLLDLHLDRLEVAGLPILVATTSKPEDDEIVDLCARRDITTYRGSEQDVLSRFDEGARREGFDAVVRVTSDCPLIDPHPVLRAVQQFLEADDPWLFLSNTLERSFPRGMDFEVFSGAALSLANAEAKKPHEREHVTPFLYEHASGRFHVEGITRSPDRSRYRLTVDTSQDYDLVRRLVEDHGGALLDCDDLCAVLDAHPELAAINAGVEQKKLGE